VKLTLHYDGGGFHGWQVQPGARTVQGELEAALSRLADERVGVLGAGRTDAGVHATGQVASALMPERWAPAEVRRALNAILPPDLWVAEAEAVPLDFHARYDATAREYEYRVGTEARCRSPFLRPYCWALAERLDAGVLAETAAALVGEHSFRAYAKSGQPERGERCTVVVSSWEPWDAGLLYRVRADRFLHHMVRYLVGTMVDAARGRRAAREVAALLAGGPGAGALETSPPAPAEGLYLTQVYYGVPGGWRRGRGHAAETAASLDDDVEAVVSPGAGREASDVASPAGEDESLRPGPIAGAYDDTPLEDGDES